MATLALPIGLPVALVIAGVAKRFPAPAAAVGAYSPAFVTVAHSIMGTGARASVGVVLVWSYRLRCDGRLAANNDNSDSQCS